MIEHNVKSFDDLTYFVSKNKINNLFQPAFILCLVEEGKAEKKDIVKFIQKFETMTDNSFDTVRSVLMKHSVIKKNEKTFSLNIEQQLTEEQKTELKNLIFFRMQQFKIKNLEVLA